MYSVVLEKISSVIFLWLLHVDIVQSDFVELTAELNRVVAEEEDGTWMKVRAMESH